MAITQRKRAVRFSHNDNWMLSCYDAGAVKYWRPNLELVKAIPAHREPVRALAFAPTDLKFATASDDATVRIWDFARCASDVTLAGHGVLEVGAGQSTAGTAGQVPIAHDLSEFQAMYPGFYNQFTSTIAGLSDAPITNIAPSSITSQYAVPLPPTLWLYGIGFAAMGLAKRKQQAA